MNRFVSLFSGAGGLDQGFVAAGWKPVMMMDNWFPAVETLRRNHPGLAVHIHQWDISALEYERFDRALRKAGGGKVYCIAGGPPCQAFSRLNQNQLFESGDGKRGSETEANMNDPRRSLFMDFLRLVAHVMPPVMIMENVFDLRTRKLGGAGPDRDEPIVGIILKEFADAGYDVVADVLDARDYNVPQMRRRMIFVGIRNDLGIGASLPPPMPLVASVRGEFARIKPKHPNQARKEHSPEWVEKIRLIPPGGYYNDLPLDRKVLKPVSLDFVASYDGQVRHYCMRRGDGSWREFRTTAGEDRIARFTDGELTMAQLGNEIGGCEIFRIMPRMGTYLRRIRWDVSHTVTRNPLIHPAEHRELTIREKASIQTFPPDYEFCGKEQEQHVLVGNAVPCNLGRAIAEHLGKVV
jgi:DNA (cytosine-5)-methyltransferase 1